LPNISCSLGELKVGTDEEVFNRIMAHESFPQLRLIFEEYKNVSGRTIEQALEAELSGELLEAMLAVGEFVLSEIHSMEQNFWEVNMTGC
jgi:annexin A7/11